MTTSDFPRGLLRERSHSWNLVGVATTPGQNAQNVAPIIRSDGGGFWSCVMSDVSLSGVKGVKAHDRQRQRIATLLWRAVRQICDGGVNNIVVPRNDALFRPWPFQATSGGVAGGPAGVPHSDLAMFSDDAGYYQSMIDVTVAADAALRATGLAIQLNWCGGLMGGESFSIQHPTFGWRLYEIATVTYDSDTAARITFMPPLREAVSVGTPLEFDRPRCVMRLARTSSMDLTVQPWTFNNASVDFIEAPPQ
jgi:hypothetical protein